MTSGNRLLAVSLISAMSTAACAATGIKVSEVAPWSERQFKTTLPKPFKEVEIVIASDDLGNVTDFRISTQVGDARLPSHLLQKLSKVSEPSVTYDKVEGSDLKVFSVHVEYGDFYYSDRFSSSFQSIAGWKVSDAMEINGFEITDFH